MFLSDPFFYLLIPLGRSSTYRSVNCLYSYRLLLLLLLHSSVAIECLDEQWVDHLWMVHHKTSATDDQSRFKEKSESEEVNSEKSSGLLY